MLQAVCKCFCFFFLGKTVGGGIQLWETMKLQTLTVRLLYIYRYIGSKYTHIEAIISIFVQQVFIHVLVHIMTVLNIFQ